MPSRNQLLRAGGDSCVDYDVAVNPIDEQPDTLEALALRHGSDKAEHGYCDFYDSLFSARRDEPLRILELGVGGFQRPHDPCFGGASLRTWRDYFPQASICGLDIYDKSGVADERIAVIQGSQTDAELLTNVSREHGPFNIIIDDASHIPGLTLESFRILFPLLAPSGIYVIEDLSTSYWPNWGGKFRRRARGTSMDLIKTRIDGLNHAEWKLPNVHPNSFDRNILEIRARHNIVAFLAGDNTIASDQNRPHPVTVAAWLRGDVVPNVVRRAKNPAVLGVLDALHVRSTARRLRRRFVPDIDR